MSEAWFFLSPEEIQASTVNLNKEILQHIRALRLREGDPLVLADGQGRAWQARLEGKIEGGASAVILEELKTHNEPPLNITLMLAITKGEIMDHTIRSAVELGVKEIVPVLTSRTVVQLPLRKREEKVSRWQKIASSAASLCRRSYLPRVKSPLNFMDMAALIAVRELVIVPWEGEREKGLLSLLQGKVVPPREVVVFIGPEGGISVEEMAKLKELPSVNPVSLGPRILSARTASLAALSIIMAFWGDMG